MWWSTWKRRWVEHALERALEEAVEQVSALALQQALTNGLPPCASHVKQAKTMHWRNMYAFLLLFLLRSCSDESIPPPSLKSWRHDRTYYVDFKSRASRSLKRSSIVLLLFQCVRLRGVDPFCTRYIHFLTYHIISYHINHIITYHITAYHMIAHLTRLTRSMTSIFDWRSSNSITMGMYPLHTATWRGVRRACVNKGQLLRIIKN